MKRRGSNLDKDNEQDVEKVKSFLNHENDWSWQRR